MMASAEGDVAQRLQDLVRSPTIATIIPDDSKRYAFQQEIQYLVDDIGLLEAALYELAIGAPPDSWEPYDAFGDCVGYSKHGQIDHVRGVDPSNSGDNHQHGHAVGLWYAAKLARSVLALTRDKQPRGL